MSLPLPDEDGPTRREQVGAAMAPLEALAQRICAQIPITQHLQFSLFEDAGGHLVATAPIAPNANHRQTAFGGSLNMLATVAGWAMTTLLLSEEDCQAEVVIQCSSIEFEAPVCGELSFQCLRPPADARARFFETFRRWGRSRLSLCCRSDGGAVTFRGAYVALTS